MVEVTLVRGIVVLAFGLDRLGGGDVLSGGGASLATGIDNTWVGA